MRGFLLGLLGAALGAAAVIGATLTFDSPAPPAAVPVSPTFCADALGEVAATWSLVIAPQQTVRGDRDRLTSCEATSEAGDVRLTLTVLAVAGEEGRTVGERSTTALVAACTAIGPAPSDEGCSGPVETADDVVGSAGSFVTTDDAAVVTILFTAPPDQAGATSSDVDRLTRALVDRSVVRG
ncbi:hypothetical protein SAMN05216561_10150 [Nocardioides psychrotolerans]|uniref:Uncharacterized protein n=1 Tax=Nocardioides psychrotolerans TaxID=1005945 RepID=A0A1I3BCC7_9ACTN|nr:hypothetical protein SAMN05216561_10150 [Nocardioides psychrotolerans]